MRKKKLGKIRSMILQLHEVIVDLEVEVAAEEKEVVAVIEVGIHIITEITEKSTKMILHLEDMEKEGVAVIDEAILIIMEKLEKNTKMTNRIEAVEIEDTVNMPVEDLEGEIEADFQDLDLMEDTVAQGTQQKEPKSESTACSKTVTTSK